MATSVKQMMEAANAAVPRITLAQAREMIAKGNTQQVYNLGAFKDWAEGGGAVDKPAEPGR